MGSDRYVQGMEPARPEISPVNVCATLEHRFPAPSSKLCQIWLHLFFHGALRPRRRDGLLGTGTEWEGDDRVKARPRKPSEKDRRDRGPPPEQWKC